MPFNGTGGFTVYTPGNPAVPGTAISSVAFNATMADFATGLANTLTRDGQSPATANIPMGGNKITGLGPATVAGQAVRFEQLPTLATLGAAASGANTDITSLGAVASINGGALAGFRNRIINGGVQVAQRGTSGVVAGTYTVDRWLIYSAGAAPTWSQLLGTLPTSNVGYYLLISGIAGNTAVSLAQRIEATNSMDLAGKTVTVSYWVYQTTGTTVTAYAAISYATAGADNFTTISTATNGGSVSVATATWVRYSAQIVVPAGGTTGLNIALYPVGGAALLGSQMCVIYGVQLELGTVATPFEQRPYGMELALCQRYYYKIGPYSTGSAAFFGTGVGVTSTIVQFVLQFPVQMRVRNTTMAFSASAFDYGVYTAGGSFQCTSLPITLSGCTDKFAMVQLTASAASMTGQAVLGYLYNNSAGFIAANAEL